MTRIIATLLFPLLTVLLGACAGVPGGGVEAGGGAAASADRPMSDLPPATGRTRNSGRG